MRRVVYAASSSAYGDSARLPKSEIDPTAPGVSGRVYNVACGRRTSPLELVALLNGLIGVNIAPTHTAARVGDVKHSQADIERAKADLGCRPTTDVREAFRRLEWRRAWAHLSRQRRAVGAV